MYRVSPFTYLVNGMMATGLANNKIVCSSIELVKFNPRAGQTCIQYMQDYINKNGGYVANPNATSNCEFCTAADTNVYLAALSSQYSTRYRNFGIMWAFIIFNVFAALFLYWLARVPRKQKVQEEPAADMASRVQSRVSRSESKGIKS